MIIIDEHTYNKLSHTLKTLPDLNGRQCLHFQPAEDHATLRQHLIASVQRHLTDARIYFGEEADVFLLAHDASGKQCRKILLDVADALNAPADQLATWYDLSVQTGALVMLLEKKIEQHRKAQETLQKQQLQKITELRRQEILHGAHIESQTIKRRRTQRDTPQLMIIEDDMFSRRLVENALQKQYRLTGLGTAEKALSTYAELAPDLLFLDIDLPDVTGHELLERIIAFDPQAYVVMLSGNADKENITQAISRGAKGFVAKPFTRDKLFQYIERCPNIRKENL